MKQKKATWGIEGGWTTEFSHSALDLFIRLSTILAKSGGETGQRLSFFFILSRTLTLIGSHNDGLTSHSFQLWTIQVVAVTKNAIPRAQNVTGLVGQRRCQESVNLAPLDWFLGEGNGMKGDFTPDKKSNITPSGVRHLNPQGVTQNRLVWLRMEVLVVYKSQPRMSPFRCGDGGVSWGFSPARGFG